MSKFSIRKTLFTGFLYLFGITTLHAQSTQPAFTCGSDILLAKLRDNPAFRSRETGMNQRIRQFTASAQSKAATDYVLPVVFHILNADPSSITDADVAAALQQLNDAYGQTGAFAGARTNTRIQFCLAKTDPDGGKTTGILRAKTYLGDFDADMEGGDVTAMGRWDGSRYINIWVVEDIKSEFMQNFECGKWRRLKMGGYASAGGDIVLAGLGVGVMAHEMGHYLSLLHTFAAMDCKNNDCATDGDMVCDTPPDKSINGGFACSDPENSCHTDTLSGFTTDVPDLPDNFMDYGGGSGCVSSFTEGQAERMRNFIATSLPGMIGSTLCSEPCADAVKAGFTRDIDFPVTGNTVQFTNTSTGATRYEWWVNGQLEATTTDFSLLTDKKQNYHVALRAYTATAGCFATHHQTVQVSCGVVARFYPDKRKIASKEDVELDSILFTNRSENATAFRWLMRNDKGMMEQSVSTDKDLRYIFKVPGTYTVRLEATDGSCTDTTNAFTFTVDDPTADGAIYVRSVDCYDKDKIRVSLYFYNFGYKEIPAKTPVSFYDRDPRLPGARLLGSPYLIPYALKGKCPSYLETTIIAAGRSDFDTVVAVLNDTGSIVPLTFPNTGIDESNYGNNFNFTKNFRFKVKIVTDEFTLQPGEQVTFSPEPDRGGDIAAGKWSLPEYLSCSDCIGPVFTAPYRKGTQLIKTFIAESKYKCYDTATVTLNLPIVDDYTVKIDGSECAAGGQVHVDFTICNQYAKGNIPPGLEVVFYDGDPAQPGAHQLGNAFQTGQFSGGACETFDRVIPGTATGKLFAIVNPAASVAETGPANNLHSAQHHGPIATVYPGDTTVIRKHSYPLHFTTEHFTPASYRWSIESGTSELSCKTCLAPDIRVLDTSVVKLVLTNRFGCTTSATAKAQQFPADLTVQIRDVKCYDNNRTYVKFQVCMQNGYDVVYGGIPVTFYDGPTARALATTFVPASQTANCVMVQFIIPSPASGEVVARVNDPGQSAAAPLVESDFTNNEHAESPMPFIVRFPEPGSLISPRPAGPLRLQPLLTGGPARNWQWEPALGLSCTTCEQPIVNRTGSSMQYRVTATNEFFCTSTAVFDLKTFIRKTVEMPTAFSPNKDGVNDVFYVIGSLNIKTVKDFIIYDRWGRSFFERHNIPANDRQFGWDGTGIKGPASAATYVYFVQVLLDDDRTETFTGTVTLIR